MSAPLVLLGHCRGKRLIDRLADLGWGRMAVERTLYPYPGEPWAMDNGVFKDHNAGLGFQRDRFETTVRKQMEREPSSPMFVVAPDIMEGGMESLWFSLRGIEDFDWVPWPWYLVVQDGMIPELVARELEPFSGVFLGGSNDFKASSQEWADVAHESGLKFHYGRCGTIRKLEHAFDVGADSLDSSFPLWTQERFDLFESTWRSLSCQGRLFGEAG